MPETIEGKIYLTTDETARRLGVTRQTVNRLVKQGLLKKYKPLYTSHIYYLQTDVEALKGVKPVEPGN